MNDIEYKLKSLQACLGEKKLKQLGLIPCLTCKEILTQLTNVCLPSNLENKVYFSPEEIATISDSILESTNGFLKTASPQINSKSTKILSDYSDSIDNPTIINKEQSDSDPNYSSLEEDTSTNPTPDLHLTPPPQTIPYSNSGVNNLPIINKQDLLTKLLVILNESQHIAQDNLGMGYIYMPPSSPPISHVLNCSECGRLYTIITDPSLKLMPLPVYLSDTEYELIKGIYVDTFL